MFLLVCWTSWFLGQVVPCRKLSALLARPFRSKELYALLQKWLTCFSVEFSISPSAGQCSHKFPFLDSVAMAIHSCQNGRKQTVWFSLIASGSVNWALMLTWQRLQTIFASVFTVCSLTWLCHHAPSLPWVWAQHIAWDNKIQWNLLLLWGPDFYQKQDLVGTRSAEQGHSIFQVYWIPWRLGKWRNHSVSSKKKTIQHILDAYSGSGTV